MDRQEELEKEPIAEESAIPKEEESDLENKKKINISAVIREILLYCLIFVLCIFVMPKVIQKTVVDGDSMEPTLQNGNHLIVERISYRFVEPKRFEVIVFYPYEKDTNEYFVKRIIGLPGETVQIKAPDIYIDGKKLEENYGKDLITYEGIAEKPIILGEDEYFLLGDNREISLDSRYEQVGPIHEDRITGRAVFRLWPLNEFGLLPKQKVE